MNVNVTNIPASIMVVYLQIKVRYDRVVRCRAEQSPQKRTWEPEGSGEILYRELLTDLLPSPRLKCR